jgi:hypothetical protein
MDTILQQAAIKAPELVVLVILCLSFLRYLRYLSEKDEARSTRHEEMEKIRIVAFDRVAGALDRNTDAFDRTIAVLAKFEGHDKKE